MNFTKRTVALAAACALLVGPAAFAGQTPAPAAPAAPKKLISPQRGDATVEITKPNTNKKGTEVTTVIMVKNTSPAPIAGFKIEENWYDKGGTPVGGDIYRHPKPFMPGEVITVTLKTQWKASMQSNQYQFTHANGAVKPKTVPKIVPAT
jgi:flagellar basal body L-ring protein FlgH